MKDPEVREVMCTGGEMSRVDTWTSMRDTIYAIARDRIGVTAVADAQGHLVGSLSLADLRSLLEHDDGSLLDRPTGDYMKTDPRTVDGGAPASSALKLMEEHGITSLFICDAEGRLEGVVHLHDLWRLELF